jgi:hypothetical protein
MRPNKAMKPTEQGESCDGLFEALQKRLVRSRRPLGLASAVTIILPPRLIASR